MKLKAYPSWIMNAIVIIIRRQIMLNGKTRIELAPHGYMKIS